MNNSNSVLLSQTLDQSLDAVAFEVARNRVGAELPITELLPALNLEETEFRGLLRNNLFQRLVRAYTKELQDNGVSFQLRAAIIAEDGLRTLYKIINDADESGQTKLKALSQAVDWGKLAPKENTALLPTGATVPTIVFNFPPGTQVPSVTIEGEVIEANDTTPGEHHGSEET